MSNNIVVQRVFGRINISNEDSFKKFNEWFADCQKLEPAIDESRPFNGEMTIDFQFPTDSWVIEVKTINQEFADELIAKFTELGFETRIIGDVKQITQEQADELSK